MSMKVKCVFPDGSTRVLPIGPQPTLNTFRLIAKNHMKTPCSKPHLRYGAPPHYVIFSLANGDTTGVLTGIRNQDTVWIDICSTCKERHWRPVKKASKNTSVYTLSDAQSKPTLYPPFSQETLSAGGYYYKLISRELGLDNFQVYSCICPRLRYLLYLSELDCLLEVPSRLISISPDESVPEENIIPSGILYQVIASHSKLEHMSFFSFPILPGRLFVFDAVLDRLIETSPSSELAKSLLGDIQMNPQDMSHDENVSTNSAEFSSPELQCVGFACSLKFETFRAPHAKEKQPLHNSDERRAYKKQSDSLPPWTNHLPINPKSIRTSECSFSTKMLPYLTVPSCKAGTCSHTKLSVAGITEFRPKELDVPLAKPSLRSVCTVPPCAYTGMNEDPR